MDNNQQTNQRPKVDKDKLEASKASKKKAMTTNQVIIKPKTNKNETASS